MNSCDSPVPPSVGRASSMLEEMDAQPQITPPKNMFCNMPIMRISHRRFMTVAAAVIWWIDIHRSLSLVLLNENNWRTQTR